MVAVSRICGVVLFACLLLLADGAWSGHTGGPDTEERVVLDSEAVKIGYLIYPPGASSGHPRESGARDRHRGGGELTLVTRRGKQVYKAGSAFHLETGSGHIALNESKAPVKFWALNMKKCD